MRLTYCCFAENAPGNEAAVAWVPKFFITVDGVGKLLIPL